MLHSSTKWPFQFGGPHYSGKSYIKKASRKNLARKRVHIDREYYELRWSYKHLAQRMPAHPNSMNNHWVNNLKGWACLRQETFNGWLKKHSPLESTFWHSMTERRFVFEATICMTIHYHLTNSSLLYEVS